MLARQRTVGCTRHACRMARASIVAADTAHHARRRTQDAPVHHRARDRGPSDAHDTEDRRLCATRRMARASIIAADTAHCRTDGVRVHHRTRHRRPSAGRATQAGPILRPPSHPIRPMQKARPMTHASTTGHNRGPHVTEKSPGRRITLDAMPMPHGARHRRTASSSVIARGPLEWIAAV